MKTETIAGADRPFGNAAVEAVFDSYSPAARDQLLRLRALIFATAADTPGVGAVEETLKWGQPSYLTPETKSGTTIRIDQVKGETGRLAMYVHCQTNLVDTFRNLYPDALTYEGNRAILLDAAGALPAEPLGHCIALALTYHRDRRRRPVR
jgi:Domain of unknown function (DU1801)